MRERNTDAKASSSVRGDRCRQRLDAQHAPSEPQEEPEETSDDASVRQRKPTTINLSREAYPLFIETSVSA
jgi:hypothetical protein